MSALQSTRVKPREPLSPLRRRLLIAAGALSLLLGVLGVILPLLPTTPFVLLTAACWAKASPQLHRWLLAQPTVGPLIERWERERSLPRKVKFTAVGMIVLSMAVPIWLWREHAWLPWALTGVALLVIGFVLRLPAAQDGPA